MVPAKPRLNLRSAGRPAGCARTVAFWFLCDLLLQFLLGLLVPHAAYKGAAVAAGE